MTVLILLGLDEPVLLLERRLEPVLLHPIGDARWSCAEALGDALDAEALVEQQLQ